MKGCIKRVLSKIVEEIIERLLNGTERKLRNSRVSKQWSHDSFVTFPHIVLQNVQFFSHNSQEVGRALFEAFKI
jgi:hypothetical protein